MSVIFKVKRKRAIQGASPYDITRVNNEQSGGVNNQYNVGDIVIYNGNYYQAIANNDAIVPTDPAYWTFLGSTSGAPQTNFSQGELAFNEFDQTFYYKSSASALEIGGQGGLIGQDGSQLVTSNKLFTSAVSVSTLSATTPHINTSSALVATTEFVQNVLSSIDGGLLDPKTLYYFSVTSGNYTDLTNWYEDSARTVSATSFPDDQTHVVILGVYRPIVINLDDENWITPLSINKDIYDLIIYSNNYARLECNIYGSTGSVTFSGNAQFNG